MNKRLILILLVGAVMFLTILFMTGCSRAVDQRQAVIDAYGYDIEVLPGHSRTYIARKPDGSIWYVRVREADVTPLIVEELQLFPPPGAENVIKAERDEL